MQVCFCDGNLCNKNGISDYVVIEGETVDDDAIIFPGGNAVDNGDDDQEPGSASSAG